MSILLDVPWKIPLVRHNVGKLAHYPPVGVERDRSW
jgi:hypothetical protein